MAFKTFAFEITIKAYSVFFKNLLILMAVASFSGAFHATFFVSVIYASFLFFQTSVYAVAGLGKHSGAAFFCGVLVVFVQILIFMLSADVSDKYIAIEPGFCNIVGNVKSCESGIIEIDKIKFLNGGEWKKSKNKVYLSVNTENTTVLSNMKISFQGEINDGGGFLFCRSKSGREWYCEAYNRSFLDALLVSANEFSKKYSDFTAKNIGDENASFVTSLLLGISDEKNVKKSIKNSGLSYLFVVSGIHFYMAYFLITFFVGLFFKNGVISEIIVFIAIFGYLMVCGISPPTFRAFCFLLIAAFARNFDYPAGRINLLALVFMMQLLINYASVYDISLYLSYSATFGIILFSRYGSYKHDYINSTISITGAVLFTAPLTGIFFNNTPFVSALFGILAAGSAVFAILPPLFLSLFFFLVKIEILSAVFLKGVNPIITVFRKFVEFLADNYGVMKSGNLSLAFEILFLISVIIYFERKKLLNSTVKNE